MCVLSSSCSIAQVNFHQNTLPRNLQDIVGYVYDEEGPLEGKNISFNVPDSSSVLNTHPVHHIQS
jgi:hypothetical protein